MDDATYVRRRSWSFLEKRDVVTETQASGNVIATAKRHGIQLEEQRSKLSRSSTVAKPIDYMLKRWDRFARFLDDERVCLSNNTDERALRGFALGRKAWLVVG